MLQIRNHWKLFLPVLLLCLCIAAVCSADEIPENAATLTEGIAADAAVPGCSAIWFRFIPEETGAYTFYSDYSETETDIYGILYQRDGEEINLIDSNTRGKDDYNFRINKKLTARTEYFLQVGFNADGDRVFPVKAERYYGLIAEQEGGQEDYYVQPGNQATLTVNASGGTGNYSYEWYRYESYSSSGTLIQDATGAALTTEPITQFTIYSCIVRDDQESSPVKLMFYVQIDNQLQAAAGGDGSGAINANAGAPVPLTVEASVCSGSIYYQWYGMKWNGSYMGWAAIPGATEATYYAQPDRLQSRYYCDVSDDYDSGSKSVYFTVNLDNHLTAEADGDSLVTVAPESPATLQVSASASAGSINYQWNVYVYNDDGSEGWVTVPGVTEATYVTDNIDRNMRVYCTVTDSYGSSSIDVWFDVQIDNQLTAEAAGDTELTVAPGSTPTLTVSASACKGPIHYQWSQSTLNDEGEWTASQIPDATGASYTTEAIEGYTIYSCRVTDEYGSDGIDISFYININNELTAWADSDTSITVDAGSPATLTVNASALAGDIHYQWYERYTDSNGTWTETLVSGATARTCTTVPEHQNTEYCCVVTDDYGSSCDNILFYVSLDNHLTAEADGDTDVTVEHEATATLTVIANANLGSIHYQWYQYGENAEGEESWNPISGATAATYTTEAMDKFTQYWCMVTDDYGSNSENVWFSVGIDNNLTMWYETDSSFTVEAGTTATLTAFASVTTGEISYQWYKCVETTEGEWTGVLIPGATETTYTTEAVYQYTQYYCAATDEYGNTNSLCFYIYPNYGLTAWPEGDTTISAEIGEEVTMTVGASVNAGGIRYQWYKGYTDEYGNMNYAEVEGAVDPAFSTDPISQPEYYYCAVMDDYGNSTSVWFDVLPDNGFTAAAVGDASVAVVPETSATLEVSASVSMGNVYCQWYKYAETTEEGWTGILIPDATGTVYTTDAIESYTQYYCNVTDDYGHSESIWFYIYPDNGLAAWPEGGNTISAEIGEEVTMTVGASVNAGGIRYQWYKGYTDEYGNMNYAEVEGAVNPAFITGPISQPEYYYCIVMDDYGNGTSIDFRVLPNNHFTAAAVGDTYVHVNPETSATLAVSASVTAGEVYYQWYKETQEADGTWNNILISNATGTEYTTDAIEGYTQYYCVVTDDYGHDQSIWFYVRVDNHLTAVAEETLSSSANIRVAPGTAATLSVFASVSVGNIHYEWRTYDDWMLIEGATGASYTTGPVNRISYYTCYVYDDFDNYRYIEFRVYVDSQLSASAEGDTELTLNPADVVTPTDLAPSPAALKVNASVGSGSIHYQWYYTNNEGDTYGSLISGAVQVEYLPRKTGRYRCAVMDDYGNTQSVWFTVGIDNLTAAAAGSTNIALTPGETADLQVTATVKSGEIHYRWYRETEDGGNYEDMHGNTYTAEADRGKATYGCFVSDDYGNEQIINFSVAVDNALHAVPATGPQFSIAKGSDVTMTVNATVASGTITYEWRHEYRTGNNSWMTTETLTDVVGPSLAATNIQRSGNYSCIVRDQYGNKETIQFEVLVDNELTITTEQESIQQVNRGDSLTLQVTAHCNEGNIQYSWDCTGSYSGNLSGNTLMLENIQRNMKITCRVTDSFGNEKKLTFLVLLDNITTLTAGHDSSVQISTGGDIAILSFVPETTGVYSLESTGGDEQTFFDTYAALYDSQWNALASNDDGGNRYNFRINYRLIRNHQYFYIVNLISPNTGTVPLRMEQIVSEAPVLGLLPLQAGQSARIPANSEYGAFVSAASSDTGALSVSGNLLTAGGSGSGTLTVTYENVTVTYSFEVLPAENVLHLPAALTTIESEAFFGNQQVKFAELGASVATVENGAFANTGLKQIVVQNPATVLKNGAFGNLCPLIICPAGSRAETFAIGSGYTYLNIP